MFWIWGYKVLSQNLYVFILYVFLPKKYNKFFQGKFYFVFCAWSSKVNQIALVFIIDTRYHVLRKFFHIHNNMLRIEELERDNLFKGSFTFKNCT